MLAIPLQRLQSWRLGLVHVALSALITAGGNTVCNNGVAHLSWKYTMAARAKAITLRP